MNAALPAFLLEAVFYLGAVFESTRGWFTTVRPKQLQGILLWVSGVLPYLVFSLLAGTYARNVFELLALLTGALSVWWVLLPRRAAYDVGFLVIAAAPVVLRVFPRIYVSPDPHLRIDALGHLMWIRLAIAALLVLREWNPGAFGFWPESREWRAGFIYYLAAIVPIVLLALGVHDVRFELARNIWWQSAAIGAGWFFAALWVIALGEEMLFRGVIERALLDRRAGKVAAITVSAVLYGSAHLWFRQFPDWRRAAVASTLGVACGIVYYQTNSVRTSMVTHALTVATWKMFFK
ncbi:MAG TPA: CPBP family intramembrane glutamic endopeptidase [Bryobacteraceae bacterium]|nr:CPBP family intramembrane glutamic endopeptidase [Bryobacteraceae bacterium]